MPVGGKAAFWLAFIGFWVTFSPLYVLGLMGMTRRLQHVDFPEWRPWLLISVIGVAILAAGAVCQITQIVVSIRRREDLRDTTGDPWDGRSLKWSTASPPPSFNFAALPQVEGQEAWWGIKQKAIESRRLPTEPDYKPIEMPRNSAVGFCTAFLAFTFGFAMIWHIWCTAILVLVAAFAGFVVLAWRDEDEIRISPETLAAAEAELRHVRQPLLEAEA